MKEMNFILHIKLWKYLFMVVILILKSAPIPSQKINFRVIMIDYFLDNLSPLKKLK